MNKTSISSLILAGGALAAAIALPSIAAEHETTELAKPAASEASTEFAQLVLTTHNDERVKMKADPLSWSADLEAEAQIWADQLAKENRMHHSPRESRNKSGENLWSGTKNRFTPDHMIMRFVQEGQYFKPGIFPDVSTTGRWQDVGHYTALIWPTTTKVGCAIAEGEKREYLVCRYFPAGNMRGRQVG